MFARAVHGVFAATAAQLFNFQWLARPAAGSLFLLFTYSSRCRLFINRSFFETVIDGLLPERVDAGPAGSAGLMLYPT